MSQNHSQYQSVTIYTIGHSTHPIEEFTGILKAYAIETLADIRKEYAAYDNAHHQLSALDAAIALMRGQSDDAPSIECYSYDGDQWFDSPDDIEFVAGRRAGDRFTLMVSHYSINRDYVVTKAPDKFGDDYEVKPTPPKDSADEQ